MAATADVLVVGGGIVASATTHALLAAGLRVVSVFPTPTPGVPFASRAAGAMLGAFGELGPDHTDLDSPELAFRVAAQRAHPDWLSELEDLADRRVFRSEGTFVIANNVGAGDRAAVQAMALAAEHWKAPHEYLDPADVPGLAPNQLYAPGLCLHLPEEDGVDAGQLLDALLAAATRDDRWRWVDDVVTSLRPVAGGWRAEAASENVEAAEVVLAAGAASWRVLEPGLLEEAGLPGLRFGKGVACVLAGAPPVAKTIRTPNRAFACGIHVVPRADGRLYLGATNALGEDAAREAGVQPGELHTLFDEGIHQLHTGLREARIESLLVGLRPVTTTGRPVVGRTALPGLSVATGTYRDGVLMAPLIGAVIAAGIAGGSAPDNPYRPGAEVEPPTRSALVERGVRDIVAFIQDPRGELPYERAEQLTAYLTRLFLAAAGEADHEEVRSAIEQRLAAEPVNETMHQLFRQLSSPPF